ncbi:hypothetical protein BZA70DRAFT_272146 [Myxozyma melibiosi]|uniref:Fungal lipase-type domain-containing protein n=1 Tax=Myxozyma melibiosi TaxID=54550 RepID=A0ABR1FD20_9ASCO
MATIAKTSTLAQLFTSASFHFMSSAVSTVSNLTQDSVHMLDSIFGSTESSRAIASIISLIRRELGDGAGLYGLVSGLTCFSILQARGWRRSIQQIEMRVLWDVVVLDTGETRTLEVKNPQVDLYDELSVIQHISPEAEVIVSTEEVTTKTTTIEVIGGSPNESKLTIPDNAIVMEEETTQDPRDGERPRYKVMFQSVSKRMNKKRGSGEEIETRNDNKRAIESSSNTSSRTYSALPTISQSPSGEEVQADFSVLAVIEDPEEPPALDLDSYQQKRRRSSDLLSSPMSTTTAAAWREKDAMSGYETPTPFDEDATIAPDSPASVSRRVSKSIMNYEDSKRTSTDGSSYGKISRHNSVPSALSAASTPRKQHSSKLQLETSQGGISNSHSGSSSPSLYRTNSERRRPSTNSVYTVKTTQSQTSLVLDATDEPQIQPFPPAHICHNLAKYMRFASASYGQAFLRLLGLGVADRIFPSTDSHHAEHHAFASHTGIGLEHILLSSYSDKAVDESGGIPLVHFVAVDHQNKTVVLTIRGTLGLEDVLTDLTCEYEDFEWRGKTYKAHTGMLKSALQLTQSSSRVLMTIKVALEELGPEYGLVLCGHSLGGGVAALLCILLAEPGPGGIWATAASSMLPPGRKIHSFAFGPTATISADLRRLTRGLVTSVIYGNDVVPCLSLGVLRDFQSVAHAFKADHRVVEELKKRVFAKLASRSGAFFDVQDDEYLWEELCKLRKEMQHEKLVPPGEVYHLTTSTVFETHDGRTRKATRVVGRVVLDVEKRFGEPVFGRGIFHHSPVYYERSLQVLERGICGDMYENE